MKLDSTAKKTLLAATEPAFEGAVQDVVDEAKRRAKSVTGKWRGSIKSQRLTAATGHYEAVVGSTLVSARAHERGAYIRPRKGDRLFVSSGDGKLRTPRAVRIPAQPAVTPAGARFLEFMGRRLSR